MKSALFKLDLGVDSVPLQFVRASNARRYILRLTPERVARVTIPRGGSTEQAFAFARKHSTWLATQLRKTATEWRDGTLIYLRGEQVPIRASESAATLGIHTIPLAPLAPLRRQVEAFLGRLALAELPGRLLELARQHNLTVRKVRIGNQRTRWGSCSASGTISLNWRLIQTPALVRDYIIVHELMHFREMNHSERFWNHVAAAFPAYLEAEAWLRKNGRLLR